MVITGTNGDCQAPCCSFIFSIGNKMIFPFIIAFPEHIRVVSSKGAELRLCLQIQNIQKIYLFILHTYRRSKDVPLKQVSKMA